MLGVAVQNSAPIVQVLKELLMMFVNVHIRARPFNGEKREIDCGYGEPFIS